MSIYIFDTKYDGNDVGTTALVELQDWTDARPARYSITKSKAGAEYESGQFYKRELPCILAALPDLETIDPSSTLVVDGYVWLAPGRPGLGMHLYDTLKSQIEDLRVVGVAKSQFNGSHAIEVVRGDSKNPLFVTSVGAMNDEMHARFVEAMAGPHRIPTMIKLADTLSRTS